MENTIGHELVVWGWCWMILGILSGSILGMWSFAGPLPLPKGYERYDSLPRRMTRLAHVAMFALPLITISYGDHIDATALSSSLKKLGGYSMIGCMIGIPITLIMGSFKNVLKYLSYIPVAMGFVALGLMAYGQLL
ncbi:MAG: hypothetical protein KDD38_04880 [Bdellovibrionales bacterium]|nr:hypothetical protein [Bdellovibrionales bacterium]